MATQRQTEAQARIDANPRTKALKNVANVQANVNAGLPKNQIPIVDPNGVTDAEIEARRTQSEDFRKEAAFAERVQNE